MVFDSASRTLTCTSTGSPATNVTWTKDGVTLTVDEQQYLVDRRASTYNNSVTINQNPASLIGSYSCFVKNALGTSNVMNFTIHGKIMLFPDLLYM